MIIVDLENNESLKKLKYLKCGDMMYVYNGHQHGNGANGVIGCDIKKVIFGCVIGIDKKHAHHIDTKFLILNVISQCVGSLMLTSYHSYNNTDAVLYDGDKEFWRFIIQ